MKSHFSYFSRVFTLLAIPLVFACGGSGGNSAGNTPPFMAQENFTTVFDTPEGRQYSSDEKLYPTDVLLPNAQEWVVEATGDIELFSELPIEFGRRTINSSLSFYGRFLMEETPDYENPQDDNGDNIYKVTLNAYVPNTQPREIIATTKLEFNVSNELDIRWRSEGLSFLALPLRRVDYIEQSKEMLLTSKRHSLPKLTPPQLIADLDGGGAAELLLTLQEHRPIPKVDYDVKRNLRPIATIVRGESIETADGALSDLAKNQKGDSVIILAPPSGLSDLQSIATLPDLDADGFPELFISAEYPVVDPNDQSVRKDTFGFYILSGKYVADAFSAKTPYIILDQNTNLAPGRLAYIQVDDSWEPVLYRAATNGGEPRLDIIGDVNNKGIPELAFSVVTNFYAFTSILNGETLANKLALGGKYMMSALAADGFTIDFNADREGGSYIRLDNDERPQAVGDLDGDGLIDMALGVTFDHDDDFLTDKISTLFLISGTAYSSLDGSIVSIEDLVRSGLARILAIESYKRSFAQSFVGLDDIDGDGFDDIYVSNVNTNYLTDSDLVYSGTFPSHVLYGSRVVFSNPSTFSISDFVARGDIVEITGTMVPSGGDLCGLVPRVVSSTKSDLDGDGNPELILTQGITCGSVNTQVVIIGSKRLAQRQSLNIQNPDDYIKAFGLGADFDYLIGLGPMRVGQSPVAISFGFFSFDLTSPSALLVELSRAEEATDSSQRLPRYPLRQVITPRP
tara:strand:+ start:475 stop:2694 length:2220 start_codon:yes stop_codon:yes gene_type:complete